MNHVCVLNQVHSPFKAKTSSNRSIIAWKTKGRRKTETIRGGGRRPRPWQPPRPSRGCHRSPWWSPRLGRVAHWPGGPSSFFERFILPSALNRGLLVLAYLHWAFWSCLLPLMLRLDIKSHIRHKTWPETLKSARKLNKAKTERNRRNCG